MNKKLLSSLGPLFGLSLFAAALLVIHKELQEYHYHDIVLQFRAIPASQIFIGSALTVLNYLIMTGYDILALRYIGNPLQYKKIAFASFIGYAFSNNIGLSMLAGGSVRYRLYSAWGLSTEDITKVVAFCTLTLWMGLFMLGGIVFFLEPMSVPESVHLPFASVRLIGLFFLFLVAVYMLWGLLKKSPITIFGWEFPLPALRISLMQITIAFLDWALAGSVLYALLPSGADISLMKFTGIFLLAQTAGLVSQVPGGLGVFETVVIVLLSKDMPASGIFSALLAYRAIYYLIPLCAAAVMLGAREVFEKREGVQRAAAFFGRWITGLTPNLLSITTFLSGIILLFSGATPTVRYRLLSLKDLLPLQVMEVSHFLGSLAGMGLLLLARGIQQRLDAAYVFTTILLGTGIVFSLFKGFDYEEALALSIMLAALLPCRRYFYRKASIFSQRFTLPWITAIAIIFLGSVWLGIFSYKHVEYSGELWWRFAFSGDASRFLRATVGTAILTIFFAAGKLLKPSPPAPSHTDQAGLDKAAAIIKTSPETYANLALLGDKELLFSKSGNSFIMFGTEGRSCVAMGDPIGPEEDWAELIWQFRETADRHEMWTVFYEIDREHLHLYLDVGLTIVKLGEEAMVPLEKFSLEGGTRKGFRHLIHHIEMKGFSFDIIPVEMIPPLIPAFRRISDSWLSEKNTREKKFSLGFFNEEYMNKFPFCVVRKGEDTVAFANIWTGSKKEELSVDIMRYLPDAPYGVMDYLFIKLMLWGRQEGYQWFNLGMAPLSGLDNRAFSSMWNRLGAFIFHHGEHFYNFRGLRQYKEKFGPLWQPKYMAIPGGLKLPHILTDLAALISGGLKGVITK
ncbi:MAG: bifunctional lysylphosphatidylglycerol flippase/synthetase MprF [Nitrospirae bacterium]|nr:bifunctional lysylphosphatidylglycerol flippase/synthetase MprF [Nitrospirota bacterium]